MHDVTWSPAMCKTNTLIGASILFSGHRNATNAYSGYIWWALYLSNQSKNVIDLFLIWRSTLLLVHGWHNLPCVQYIQCCTHLFPWHHQNATKSRLVGFNIGISPRICQITQFKPLLKFCHYTVCYHEPIKDTLPQILILCNVLCIFVCCTRYLYTKVAVM